MDLMIEHETALVRLARERLSRINSVRLFGPEDAAGIVSFAVDGAHPHDVGTILDEAGVAIRAGQHCAQPLMEHLGVPATARASFRSEEQTSELQSLMRLPYYVLCLTKQTIHIEHT